MQDKPINRRSSKKRQTRRTVCLSLVLTVMLVAGKTVIDKANEYADYQNDTRSYAGIVDSNAHRTKDNSGYYIDAYEVAQDIKKVEIHSDEEFYHTLFSVMRNIDYQKEKHLHSIVGFLNLDSLNAENSVYPSEVEFYTFLENYGIMDDDGHIDFERWKSIDRIMYEQISELEGYRK